MRKKAFDHQNNKESVKKWTYRLARHMGINLLSGYHNRPLAGKVAMVEACEAERGRSLAVSLAKAGANISLLYTQSEEEAYKTLELVEAQGVWAMLIRGKQQNEDFYKFALQQTINRFGAVHILINNPQRNR